MYIISFITIIFLFCDCYRLRVLLIIIGSYDCQISSKANTLIALVDKNLRQISDVNSYLEFQFRPIIR